jgi:sugar phosphate isomerase/epimerase
LYLSVEKEMEKHQPSRREFLARTGMVTAGCLLGGWAGRSGTSSGESELFEISLAQWSLHRSLYGDGRRKLAGLSAKEVRQAFLDDTASILHGKLDPLDFARTARQEFGLNAVEYVNVFLFDKAQDKAYLREMKTRAEDQEVKSLLIMCDLEGALGAPDPELRQTAVRNHYRWVEAAAFLDCHSIRVNAGSAGSWEEQQKLAADGLHQLGDFGEQLGINILVENHGGLSSNGSWLAGTIKMADHPRVGTLPDFGNFNISAEESYDRYQGLRELMPFAKAVSAKANDFDADGNEASMDFTRLVRIVLDAGYRGYLGVEYEGNSLGEHQGIRATIALLRRVRQELEKEYS